MDQLFNKIETVEFIQVYFEKTDWYMLNRDLKNILNENLSDNKQELENIVITGKVHIGSNCQIGPFTFIEGPVFIGDNVEIGPGVHIRPGSVISDNCVVGHASEVKNSLMMSGSKTANHNLVADSIMGVKARIGGHSETANRRFDQQPITWNFKKGEVETGIDKLGAIIGEEARVGGDVMLSPGTVVGMKTFISSGISVGGYIPAHKFVKVKTEMITTDNKFEGELHNKSKLFG